ncbi:ABC transporter ATP-binding protein [Rhizobium ruizarguesonis]|uniref:ABC transporter ATP-binding protein n=1 Tax=Rhizobium ruizarguesonis TaxID=2081791 RepID=UPI0013C18EDE|nr:ABC transporter ATP-binding protein [Rhizobium ruizarguesonis]NEI96419.1 dipeptide ABC transporter ATP-binding protein [Rhizobium ruizarguesonis]NEJ33958.1 dipeptide ABC transporter ATP-binding protein [Rhizobium ruizarguesonis]
MNEPLLEIRNLTVGLPQSADRPHAVEAISFSVGAGEIVCVVGESGSGKSVTSHAVMGLLPKGLTVGAGEILLQGEDVLKATPARLRALRGTRMAMIFQEPMTALNPVVRCGEQIDEVLRIHTDLNPAERKEKVLAIMEAVHLPDPQRMYASYPHQLSGGQRQRIMIAQALILDPALLIADEPTTALDVTTQAQILKLIAEVQQRRGTGVLFITHDFGVVADIADRVVVMQRGKLMEQGGASQVLRSPAQPYTRTLIDAVPKLNPPNRTENTGPIRLETVKLSKFYGAPRLIKKGAGVHAVNSVDFRLRAGETLGIVGESGSGKSTVARCIARLVNPTSGAIITGEADIANLPERHLRAHRQRCQIVFQDPYRSLNPRRTVGASIVEGPINFGATQDHARNRARELMSLVGLSPDALDRYPHQFSGGQRQRICIARALAMEPEILIADEAVSALDVSVQAQVLELLEDVRQKFNLAMLFITHDLRVAAQICDRILVMKSGCVVEHGPTAELFAAPKDPYTKALFEAAPGQAFEFASLLPA